MNGSNRKKKIIKNQTEKVISGFCAQSSYGWSGKFLGPVMIVMIGKERQAASTFYEKRARQMFQ